MIHILVNFMHSFIYQTKPRHGVIFLRNLASEVPPLVENTGLIFVTF